MSIEKVAIITAGGSGMGAAAVRQLAAEGYKVSILSVSGKAESLAQEIGGIGLTGSNQRNEDLERLVNNTLEKWGRIDALINSAGHGARKPLLDMTDEDWLSGMNTYLMPVIRAARLVTPFMQRQGGGAIVNISSFGTFEPTPAFPASGVFRAGLASYTKLYSDRYAAENIRMNNILPGFIDTTGQTDDIKNRVPMKRYGTVEEIGKTIAFLVSSGAGYITGQNIRIDGGITRSV